MKLTKELLLLSSLQDEAQHQVVIRISHNGDIRDVSTGIECRLSDWDNTEKSILPSDPDCRLKNEIIDGCYRRFAGEIQDFLDSSLSNSLDLIIHKFMQRNGDGGQSIDDHPPADNTKLLEIIETKMNSTLSLNTKRNYSVLHKFCKIHFPENPSLNGQVACFIDRFIETLTSHYPDQQAKQLSLMTNLKAAINFSRQEGILLDKSKIRFPRFYSNPTLRDIPVLHLKHVFKVYRDRLNLDPEMLQEGTLAISIFILDIAFQGLAPVDLARLKCGHITFSEETGDSTHISHFKHSSADVLKSIEIQTYRKKTGHPVRIIAWLEPVETVLNNLMKDKKTTDFLLPCFYSGRNYSQEQEQNRLSNWFNKQTRLLNKILIEEYQKRKWGTPPHLTFYRARHSFCNLADSLDLPRHIIQTMLGHKTTTLEKYYIRTLTPWEQVLISRSIFKLLE